MSYNGDLNAVNTAPLSSPSIQSREEIEGGATDLLMGGELELLFCFEDDLNLSRVELLCRTSRSCDELL